MTPGALALDVAGTRLWLRPDGTVWWPDEFTLFAADLHLGKGAAFRAQGQPVPAGSSRQTLHQLETAAQACAAQRIVLLGDLWHHRAGVTDEVQAGLGALTRRWPTLLVLGNHDRPLAAQALPGLGLEACSAPHRLGPLLALHEPAFGAAGHATQAPTRDGLALAGHLHPAVQLGQGAGDRLRRPCFVRVGAELILPAFGAWTGTWSRTPAAYSTLGARVAVLGTDAVHWLPAAA